MGDLLDSIVIQFGETIDSSDGAFAIVDYDSELNNEKTSFKIDDKVYLYFHGDSSLYIDKIETTSGDCYINGSIERSITEQQKFFIDLQTIIQLSRIPKGKVSAMWYGNEAQLNVNKRNITVDKKPCIGDLSYKFNATSLIVEPPKNVIEPWYLGIVITVEKL